MRLRGNGNLCIGTTTAPTEKLLVEGTSRFTGIMTCSSTLDCTGTAIFRNKISSTLIANRVITFFESNDNQYTGFGINSDQIRYQVASNAAHHTFFVVLTLLHRIN